jgi:serine/threonine protein kinase
MNLSPTATYDEEHLLSVASRKATFHLCEKPPTFTSTTCQRIAKDAIRRVETLHESSASFPNSLNGVEFIHHSQIDLGSVIGIGGFSVVYTVKSVRRPLLSSMSNIRSGRKGFDSDKVVVKFLLPKLYSNPALLAASAGDLVKEGMLLSSLDHPNIVSMKGCAPQGAAAYLNGHHDAFFLVLERLHITLSDRLKDWQIEQLHKPTFQRSSSSSSSGRLFRSPRSSTSAVASRRPDAAILAERLDCTVQLSRAIAYLHKRDIIHRDLKPPNIGFTIDGVLKVFDFDVARTIPRRHDADAVGVGVDNADAAGTTRLRITKDGDDNVTFRMTKYVGSRRYMSPECGRGEPYNTKSEVYTFALLCHEVLTLVKPYSDIPFEDHNELVFHRGLRPSIPNMLPRQIKKLLQSAWSDTMKDRPTMTTVGTVLDEVISTIEETTSEISSPSTTSATISSSPVSPRIVGEDNKNGSQQFHHHHHHHQQQQQQQQQQQEEGNPSPTSEIASSSNKKSFLRRYLQKDTRTVVEASQ